MSTIAPRSPGARAQPTFSGPLGALESRPGRGGQEIFSHLELNSVPAGGHAAGQGCCRPSCAATAATAAVAYHRNHQDRRPYVAGAARNKPLAPAGLNPPATSSTAGGNAAASSGAPPATKPCWRWAGDGNPRAGNKLSCARAPAPSLFFSERIRAGLEFRDFEVVTPHKAKLLPQAVVGLHNGRHERPTLKLDANIEQRIRFHRRISFCKPRDINDPPVTLPKPNPEHDRSPSRTAVC